MQRRNSKKMRATRDGHDSPTAKRGKTRVLFVSSNYYFVKQKHYILKLFCCCPKHQENNRLTILLNNILTCYFERLPYVALARFASSWCNRQGQYVNRNSISTSDIDWNMQHSIFICNFYAIVSEMILYYCGGEKRLFILSLNQDKLCIN